jgi:23S rRNA (adenine2030-N6)-methyltransferase
MLSYQHAYHAGGPADVHKHALLVLVLDHLRRKDKPFIVLDLQAGEGVYDLTSPEALKTGEYARGIGRVWQQRTGGPALTAYLAAIDTLNPAALQTYPGSPAISQHGLRAQDRLILNELHPSAHATLRRWARRDHRITVHNRNAGEALGALLPPEIRRGLVLVDPSYEDRHEYATTAAQVTNAVTKWAEGIFAVWYPLLADNRHQPLWDGLAKLKQPMLASELHLDVGGLADAPELGLRGSGMIMINPPWQFAAEAAALGDDLVRLLGDGPAAHHTLTWINPDR